MALVVPFFVEMIIVGMVLFQQQYQNFCLVMGFGL